MSAFSFYGGKEGKERVRFGVWWGVVAVLVVLLLLVVLVVMGRIVASTPPQTPNTPFPEKNTHNAASPSPSPAASPPPAGATSSH